MAEVFAEYGTIGVVVVLFSYMIINQIKNSKEMSEDMETIKQSIRKMEAVVDNSQTVIIKVVDRFNTSDSAIIGKLDSIQESSDRRHERLVGEIDGLSNDVNFLKGRINGSGGR